VQALLAVGSAEHGVLTRLLEQDPALNVIGEADEGRGFLELVREAQPDLVLLDWDLPEIRAADLAAARRSLKQPLRAVAFGQGQEARRTAVAAGVDAFVSREEPIERLLNTVRTTSGLSRCCVG
jgi:two-component system response regulator DesR